ncbi:hypothetical protein PAAG_08591 [Paracoccidioides lutzii Pb01]|uniref:Uncharacterized protein n=1 Tax=Paracoccidioides lutzii (strain ATCC MYA-826 / Pb01) TaxID=502779 RepID=C1HCV0_PARBA|nr:hypothetical protein PAAG_08591 [Paracoccidioides lutzii Pb01]EEH39322.1 hypothetical protein PAAG_08591 [Paracoccidioides lutzii Pb01]
MGWFWGNSVESDPTKNLDPSLKDFLKQETPAGYNLTTVQPQEEKKPSYPQPAVANECTMPSDKPSVPSASLFPDGRYAHLWKDYKSVEVLEGSSMSPAERVIDQSKKRKEALNVAALENCAEEQLNLSMCFKSGTVKERATMCSEKNSKFSRCYTMQIKFLQALGYASSFEYDSDEEERIQMHADKLFHQMLDYEHRVKEAKSAGLEPPPPQSLFKPNIQSISQSADPTTNTTITTTPEVASKSTNSDREIPGGEKIPGNTKFSKPLKDMTPHERELELQVLHQKRAQQGIYMQEVGGVLKAENSARVKRREKLSGWFGDTIAKYLA